jgi:Protein of unknown function (DUF1320)
MGAVYVSPAQLLNYVNPISLADVALAIQQQACVDASAVADGYLGVKYPLPLASAGTMVPRYTAYVAIYQLLVGRGYNPSAGPDSNVERMYMLAVGDPSIPGSVQQAWFPAVARGSIIPDVTVNLPPSPLFQLPQVWTKPPRGW